jgi:outer membrane immunogenic protein
MKRFFLTVMLSIIGVGSALAADFSQPAPPPPEALPATVAVYNWGGIYFGLNGGWAFGASNWTGGAASSGSFDTSGAVFGGTAGANFQAEEFVFGVETDFDYAPVNGNGPGGFCLNCQTSSTWLGTTRVRAGYAADRILFYGTAGGAYGDVRASAFNTTNSSTEFGWTAGAGVETAITDNWTGRIEYLYVNLSRGSCTSACGSPPAAAQSIIFDESMVRVGIDYKFRP